eukprot:GEMP01022508.1.p1 GENE.GEMP01022508.1~~GEMP01022508.1.p1  ORF type:complete len:604 (+),score=63.77 GEMP01022508.1:188-1999(+)
MAGIYNSRATPLLKENESDPLLSRGFEGENGTPKSTGVLFRTSSAVSDMSDTSAWRTSAARLTDAVFGRVQTTQVSGEWYIRKRFSLAHFAASRFFYIYCAYILSMFFIGTISLKLAAPAMSYTAATFMSVSCISQSGLSVVDWGSMPVSAHVVSFVLMILGSGPLLTVMPIIFRIISFRRQRASFARKTREKMGEQMTSYWAMHRESFIQGYGLEYQALWKMLHIVGVYFVVVQLVGWLALALYFHIFALELELDRKEWNALYIAVSAFQNNGLTLSHTSLGNMRYHPIPLFIVMIIMMLGSVALPIALRIVTYLAKISARPSEKPAYEFLLKYPRRCYMHMFPATHTLWLFLVLIWLTLFLAIVIVWRDRDSAAFRNMNHTQFFMNTLFISVSSRTAGMSSFDVEYLSMATSYLMMVWMYISASPTVVVMRQSANTPTQWDDGFSGQVDIAGIAEGTENISPEHGNTVRSQARRYFLQHSVYLITIIFFILCLEREQLANAIRTPTKAPEGVEGIEYSEFGFFRIVFDVISAYGTVGISLGAASSSESFSSMLSTGSQLLVCVAMFLGRIRGLPDSIDSSVVGYHTKLDDDHLTEGVLFSA